MLTEQEKRVAILYAQGNKYFAICEKLGIKRRTLNFHSSQIREKMGKHTTLGAIIQALIDGHISNSEIMGGLNEESK